MNKEKRDIILYNVRQFLNENQNLKDMNIHCLLIDKNNNKNGIAIASNEEYIVAIDIENYECEYSQEWDYDIDMNIFRHLENEMNIEFITPQWHCLIWKKIESYEFIDSIFHKEGMQKYLKYCKDEEITQELLQEECDTDVTDIMKYSNDYIADNNGVIEMSRGKYQEQNEVNYIAFVLGYDLLNEMLTNSETKECDTNYDFCNYLANKFLETDYYKNERNSTYDNLREWIEDKTDIIKSEHLFFTDQDNKVIIETGKRNNDSIALIEENKNNKKQYIVALGYKVTNSNIQLEYSFLYGDNLKNAKNDFERAKNGDDLLYNNKETKMKYKEREAR